MFPMLYLTDIIFLLINKMNKTKSSKLTHRQPMRLLFKIRGNPKGVMRTLENQSDNDETTNKSFIVNPPTHHQEDYEQRYSNTRMRTEYSDRFGQFRRANHSFHHIKRPHQDRQSPIKDAETDINRSTVKSFSKFQLPQLNEEQIEHKTIESKKEEHLLPEIMEVPHSFEEIEEKIEGLMTKRLHECLEFKNKGDWVIDAQLTKLLEAYKEIKLAKNPQTQEEDINLLTRKIAILQKLIAESMTESDIVKKYYMGKVANHHWKRHKTQSFSQVEQVKAVNREHKFQSLVGTSNNQDSYQQPDRAAYNIERRSNYHFNPDRHMQPLPRSSYNRDFLTYGTVQNMSACKPTENECLKAASSAKIMNSSYRSNFVAKKAEKINIKELDACRDKIKNLPIIFGKKEKDLIAYNMATYFKLRKNQALERSREEKIEKVERTEMSPNPHHFTTESHKEYIKAVQIAPSEIKHRNLQRLKYGYKKELHV